MKEVCHITTVHSRYDIRIFQKECKSLAAHFKVYLIVADGLGNEVVDSVSIIDSGKRPDSALLRIVSASVKAYRKALALKECSVFHFHDPELLGVGLLLKLLHRKKVVFDVHEDVPEDILLKHWIPRPVKKNVSLAYEMIESFITRRFDLIVCSTPHIRNRFLAFNHNSIDIKNYPHVQTQIVDIDPEDKNIEYELCYIGSIAAERGIYHILNVLPEANTNFALAGVYDNADIECQIKKHPNWKLVQYKGVLTAAQVKNLLSASRVGLVVLDSTPTFVTSLPIKLFEYMAAGLAVIASDFPLWREIVIGENCGICIPPSSDHELLKAINYLRDHPQETLQMARNGIRAIKEKYRWEVEYETLKKAYFDLLKDSR